MLRKLFGRSSGSIPVSPGLIEEEFVRQFPNAKIIAGTKHVPKNQLAFIGRSGSGEAPPVNVTGVAWPQNRNKPFKIVSFYTTHNEYKQLAERLRATLDRFQLPYDLTPVENRGAWEFNCALKARYIQDQWRRSDIPVVWVDADATIESNPVLFGSIDADFAIHKWKGWQFGSGTVYFGKSDLAKQLLDQWARRCDADPTTYDQVHLHSAWCDISSFAPLRTIWLPRSYLDIFDKPSRTEKGSVIRHWQASRLLKADGRTTGRSPARMTKDGKHNRAANLL